MDFSTRNIIAIMLVAGAISILLLLGGVHELDAEGTAAFLLFVSYHVYEWRRSPAEAAAKAERERIEEEGEKAAYSAALEQAYSFFRELRDEVLTAALGDPLAKEGDMPRALLLHRLRSALDGAVFPEDDVDVGDWDEDERGTVIDHLREVVDIAFEEPEVGEGLDELLSAEAKQTSLRMRRLVEDVLEAAEV